MPIRRNIRAPLPEGTFEERFDKGAIDLTKWTVSDNVGLPPQQPGVQLGLGPKEYGTHNNFFSPASLDFSHGMMQMKLTQAQVGSSPAGTFYDGTEGQGHYDGEPNSCGGSFTSTGAEIATIEKFHFGTYEFVCRPSSTAAAPTDEGVAVSGSITGLFSYHDGSQEDPPTDEYNEIDFEVEGKTWHNLSNYWSLTSWNHTLPIDWNHEETVNRHHKTFQQNPESGFSNLKFVWTSTSVVFYVNGALSYTVTNPVYVPQAPCRILINHWGGNFIWWAGCATPGVDRYMYVSLVRYTPPP